MIVSSSNNAHANVAEAGYDDTQSKSKDNNSIDLVSDSEAYIVELVHHQQPSNEPQLLLLAADSRAELPSLQQPASSIPVLALNGISTPWIIDSGATKHVTSCRELLGPLQPELEVASVRTASGQNYKVSGKGQATIQLSSGEITSILDVLYVPGVTKNLLSVEAIADAGVLLVFSTSKCLLLEKDSKRLLATASRLHNSDFYQLESHHLPIAKLAEMYAVTAKSSTSAALAWHRRLGHINFRRLHDLTVNNSTTGLPVISLENLPCATSLSGKQTRKNIPRSRTNRATQALHLLYADVCGPFRHKSLNKARYFVLFVDDYSRRMWVFFIKTKA